MKQLRAWVCAFTCLWMLPIHGADLRWKAPVSGPWSHPENWDPPAVPGPADTVDIVQPGTYEISVDQDTTVARLSLGNPTGIQTLRMASGKRLSVTEQGNVNPGGFLSLLYGTLDGRLEIGASGRLAADGGGPKTLTGELTIAVGGQCDWRGWDYDGNGSLWLNALRVSNEGTLRWLSGEVTCTGTVVSNRGLWQVEGPGRFTDFSVESASAIHNLGIIRKSIGANYARFEVRTLLNSGRIEVEQGSLGWIGGRGTLGGEWAAAPGASLALTGRLTNDTAVTFSGDAVFGQGDLWLGGAGQPSGLSLVSGTLHLLPAFQGGSITNLVLHGIALNGIHRLVGWLVSSNSTLSGELAIQPGAILSFTGTTANTLQQLQLLNEGTVRWQEGRLTFRSGTHGTVVTNRGLWRIETDNAAGIDGGSSNVTFINEGILRKTAGPGPASIMGLTLINGGRVEVERGRLQLAGLQGELTGDWAAAEGASLSFDACALTNAFPATFTGSSVVQGGEFWLGGAAPPSGLKIGRTTLHLLPTFQGGSITNLMLDGPTLVGTNRVTGRLTLGTSTLTGGLTIEAGGRLEVAGTATLSGNLTVEPGGGLDLAGSATKTFSNLRLNNRGTVRWLDGLILVPGVSERSYLTNQGLWQIECDNDLTSPVAGSHPVFYNTGLVRKVAGPGMTRLFNVQFVNRSVVEAATGTLELPEGFALVDGVLRPTGGTLGRAAGFQVDGGRIEGNGSILGAQFHGGILSPGVFGPGSLRFTDGLHLSPEVTVELDVGTFPNGDPLDSLMVSGTVDLGSAALRLTGVDASEPRQTLLLIDNDEIDRVAGTFAGLPDGALLDIGSQSFRIRYEAGTGNDVALIRDDGSLRLNRPSMHPDGSFRASGWGARAATYSVQLSTNLLDWIPVGTVSTDSGGLFDVSEQAAPEPSRQFYRILGP